jgi:type VI secretion system protein ImpF
MPRYQDTENAVTLSILDRLMDNERERKTEIPLGRAQSLRELRASLRRDLEWLLNSRRSPIDVPETFTECQRSLVVYGLPDLSSLTVQSAADQARLIRGMEEAISHFEPRLTAVKVSLAPVATGSRMLRFVIEAMLNIDPAPEHITFDTVLELNSGEYAVKGENGAR